MTEEQIRRDQIRKDIAIIQKYMPTGKCISDGEFLLKAYSESLMKILEQQETRKKA